MQLYTQIYEFAASAGAFEGYVYRKTEADVFMLSRWVDHLVAAYRLLPPEARDQFQGSLNGTLGRATASLLPVLGEGHEIIGKLKTMLSGRLPASADDFQKKKWFEK